MTDPGPVLGRRAPEQRRAAVLDAARALFLHGGVAGTSVDAIARRAGVAKGTVYLSFPTKEHLVRAIEADFNGRIVRRTSAAARAASEGVSPAEAWCVELVRSYLDDLDVHDMLFYGGAAASREAVAANALIDDLEALLHALGAEDPAATAGFLVGGITLLADRAILEGRADPPTSLLEASRRLASATIAASGAAVTLPDDGR